MPAFFCPVCGRYSSKYSSESQLDAHIISVHPKSKEALALTNPPRARGYAQK